MARSASVCQVLNPIAYSSSRISSFAEKPGFLMERTSKAVDSLGLLAVFDLSRQTTLLEYRFDFNRGRVCLAFLLPSLLSLAFFVVDKR